MKSARPALGRVSDESSADRPAAPLPRLPIPLAPSLRQGMVRGGAPLFGSRSAAAMERLARRAGQSLVMSGAELANRLSGMEMRYKAVRAALIDSGSDAEFFQYAKAIAQHAAALGELLYGRPLRAATSAPPGPLTDAALEALFNQGPPADLTTVLSRAELARVAVDGIDLASDDMHFAAESAGRGVALLYHAAAHAAERWADFDAMGKTKVGKTDVQSLVTALAALYALAFNAEPMRHASAKSPVVVFCSIAAGALFRRMARQLGIPVMGARKHPLPPLLQELKNIAWIPGRHSEAGTSAAGRRPASASQSGAAKVVNHLRPRRLRPRRAKPQRRQRS